jgi:hypothetical protein
VVFSLAHGPKAAPAPEPRNIGDPDLGGAYAA